jgi:hypothetical protein
VWLFKLTKPPAALSASKLFPPVKVESLAKKRRSAPRASSPYRGFQPVFSRVSKIGSPAPLWSVSTAGHLKRAIKKRTTRKRDGSAYPV